MNPEDLFRAMEPPVLPGSLRGRVLSSVREATPPPETTLVDGLWASRRLRFAWTILVLALLAGHVSLSFETGVVSSPAAAAPVAPETDLGFAEGSLPPTMAHRLQNNSPLKRGPRLIDVWLDSTLTAWM